MGFKKLNVNI